MPHNAALVFWSCWAVVVYTYAGFPVLLAVAARAWRRQGDAAMPTKEDLPRVAMVVAAYNEAGVLARKLENSWAIDYPADRFTLLIGSDGSDDGTAEILNRCADARLRATNFPARRGKISVLNDLMRGVDAEIVVFSDANTMYAPDAVKRLVAPFADRAVGCVSGELGLESGDVSGEGLYWKYEGWIKRNESRLGFLIGCNGGIFAIRPELYRALPAGTLVEDFVLSMAVLEQGYEVRFDPEARAFEPPCPTARAEMIRKIRIGAGGFQAIGLTWRLLLPTRGEIAFAYWGHKVLRWLAPVFLVTALTANVLLLGSSGYRMLLAGQLLGAWIAVLAYRSGSGRSLPRWTRPISYFYLMNYALLCGLLRFVTRSQRVTWDRASR